jgi:hypothetical protein
MLGDPDPWGGDPPGGSRTAGSVTQPTYISPSIGPVVDFQGDRSLNFLVEVRRDYLEVTR